MGGKKSGAARTPNIQKNTLYSYQKLKVVDLIGAGEIAGFFNGNDFPLKSVYLNDTPVQNKDGSLNHSGISIQYSNGSIDQGYLPGFTSVDNAVTVGAEVEQQVPITRTVVNPLVTSVRVTVGVDALMQSTKEGDQLGASVDMVIYILKNGFIYTSQSMHLSEKGSQPFRLDFIFNDVPAAPFDIQCIRLTPDSKDDMLRNKTFFFSYVESVDAKFRYPKTAVIGLELDSKQFGSNNPTRTYLLKGSIVQVPSNYNAATRSYIGLWDRLLKPAFTNNPAWILYDLLTDEIDGFGERFKNYAIDIDKLYELSKYCDELVDDGNGGKEPRFVCNIVLFGGDAYEVIHNICSIFRGLPSFSNDKFTIYYDRKTEISAVYNNSNVVEGIFEYAMVARTEQFNQIQVEYVDQDDGYRTKIDELSDEKHILKNGLNTQSIVAYGCTKRSYALRCAKWNLVTNLTENEYVSFKVGASGVRHELYDILKIADNDYVGLPVAGRIEKAVGNAITLDRELSNVKNFTINTDGKTEIFTVKKVIDAKTYEVDKPVTIVDYAPFVATLNNVEPRLFRCIGITEEDGGIYAITCIKHNPQKEAMVDKGAKYIEGNYTLINPLPALSNGIVVNEGRAIILEWDALTVVGSANKYTIKLYKGNELYHNYTTTETRLKLGNLPQGNYVARIRAINEQGQYSDELVIAFSTTYELTGIRYNSIVFGISLFWEVPPLITSNAYTEIWWSEEDDRLTATIAAKLPYPQNNYSITNLSVKESRYFWFRLVDEDGNQGEFTHVLYAESSSDASNILDYLKGKITETELGDEVINGIIKDVIADEQLLAEIEQSLGGLDEKITHEVSQEIASSLADLDERMAEIIDQSAVILKINERIATSESELQVLSFNQALSDSALTAQMLLIDAKTDDNIAKISSLDKSTTDKFSAQAQSMTQLESKVNSNDTAVNSKITNLQKTTSDQLAAQAQSISKLDTKTGANTTSITALDKALTDEQKSTVTRFSEVNAKTGANTTNITVVDKALTDEKKSTVTRFSEVNAKAGANTTSITVLDKALTDEKKSTVTRFSEVNAKVGSHTASIAETKETIAKIDGSVKAMYTLTANANGKITGFKFGTDGATSVFNIMADSFVITNQKNGEVQTPFILSQNKLALDGDLIATGSISGNKIVANTEIQAPIIKGGSIKAGHFEGGRIDIGNGNFTIDQNGNLTAKNGTFGGTVYANKILGDIDFSRAAALGAEQAVGTSPGVNSGLHAVPAGCVVTRSTWVNNGWINVFYRPIIRTGR